MRFLILLVTVFCAQATNAQHFYKSPYVSNDSSYRYVLPPNFHQWDSYTTYGGMHKSSYEYFQREGLFGTGFSDLYILTKHVDSTDNILSVLDEYCVDHLEHVTDSIDTFILSSGQVFYVMNAEVQNEKSEVARSYGAITQFDSVYSIVILEDYRFMLANHPDASLFHAILKSFSVYATNRENSFNREEEEWEFEH